MLTRLTIRSFKLFDEVSIELADRVVLIGPNNSGKTSALQALALWDIGAKRWVEKRGAGNVPEKRPGVTINRKDLIAVPVPAANLLWRDLHTRQSARGGGTEKIDIEGTVEGVTGGKGLGRCQVSATGQAVGTGGATLPQSSGGRVGTSSPAPAQPKRFHGTVTLDATRVGRDASRIADEVISHLSGLVGATVRVTLEVEAEIPSGAPDHVVRTVTENSRTLEFTSQGFEKE
jgi:hypothetical protein